MRIEIWSDVVCPFCYIGKRHLEAALADFSAAEPVEVIWRSFELDPDSPRGGSEDTLTALMQKYRQSREQILQMMERVQNMGAQVGLDLQLQKTKRTNTLDVHRLLYLAAQEGLQGAAKERLLRAYFSESEHLGETETLVRLLTEVGLEPEAIRKTLADPQAFFNEVDADLCEARNIGITGVPFFVFDQKYAVSGAQPVAVFTQILQKCQQESAAEHEMAAEVGLSCGEERCEIENP
ncbi:disulfide bond formation protein DsbA [bacterium (Candidatus Blackallbacteria) CG17_big_fil_post_rev_8_21_14_2_50_48_46]|uniref:Disulfide bond formation protein DsbA n=1 Tax=bacterium (Candidatus Blackallbacteria) CG17_big_fil_post_rev_8_21_14_2_50_48_46 TaxID=2014261 RepID=A0A2M7G2V9_9BACT|nr:MAG: disulfide bond formation protein DsbA [bacterium (Candidatus Blackallbacteria) CG18_big_fil_WC_8_21_14_2_50_49_26]PIW16163.1 MAG: disulfide bond formation protein DsbA [bacterium (Candidatus Blackallbacteria) CG17_big_fil_post_rev_8_21_14_2_50_48_46]PIW44250.1 MAG: disulfide bond formation protein DsbA [bacterium (Candidatus Blackallbacteria) CG13_big_fil_rev_8_21_14_2_50_49_14]